MVSDRFLLRSYSIAILTVLELSGLGIARAATPSVTASLDHGMSLTAQGTACAAGDNQYGDLGDGTVVTQWTPVQVTNLVGAISAIDTGSYHTLAVKTDGTVWSWGYNGYGEPGTGNNTNRVSPFPIPGLTN